MKYIVKNSDIQLNGKIIPEGSEVELSKEQTKGIEDFLIPVANPELVSGSQTDSESETKNKIKKKSYRGKK